MAAPFSYGINIYLNGMFNHKHIQEFELNGRRGWGVRKFTQIRRPAETVLFGAKFEGLPINGGMFQYPEPDRTWINLPADWHNHGMNYAFTDGHVDYKKWQYEKRGRKDHVTNWRDGAPLPVANESDLEDLRWTQRTLIPD